MKYAIVFSSQTGNTRQLAEAVRTSLPQADCLYFGPPCEQALEAGMLYVGFWTDKGTCDAQTAAFLRTVGARRLFLFGTAGFGGSQVYYERILANVRKELPGEALLCGTYMFQGKMPPSVRRRYEALENMPNRQAFLDNFDRAATHPDAQDVERLLAVLPGPHQEG